MSASARVRASARVSARRVTVRARAGVRVSVTAVTAQPITDLCLGLGAG